MNIDEALEQFRNAPIEPPVFAEVRRRRSPSGVSGGRVRLTLLATLLAAVAFVCMTALGWVMTAGYLPHWTWVLGGPSVAALGASAVLVYATRLVRRGGVGPHILVRAILWSNLVIGMLMANFYGPVYFRLAAAVVAVGCGAALLLAGRLGLDEVQPTDPFVPVRFRGRLLIALVMAFADAQTLVFSGLLQALRAPVDALPTLTAGAVMIAAVWGLYRLRTWALALNLVANLVIAGLALNGALGLSVPVSGALAATAVVQALLPVPLIATALGDRNAGRSVLARHASLLAAAVIVVAVGFAVLGVLDNDRRAQTGWFESQNLARQRGVNPVRAGAQLQGRDLTGIELRGRDLRRIDLTGAQLVGAQLDSADLRGATLRGSFLGRASIRDTDLRGADLSGAVLVGADLTDADLHDAVVDGTRWAGAICPDGHRAESHGGVCPIGGH